MVKMPISLFAFAFAFVPSAEAAELPYRFRSELEIVHEENVRDRSLQPRADEFVFADAMAVSVPESDFLRRVAIDFADYLLRSQGVSVRVASGSGVAEVKVGISPGLRSREYTLDVSRGGIEIEAADERAAAQAFYHLEDLMNLRRSPFLKIGKSRRRILFSPLSGWFEISCFYWNLPRSRHRLEQHL